MFKFIALATSIAGALLGAPAHAELRNTPDFVRGLDRNGSFSAGWVDELPELATICNLRLDNRELTDKLLNLSREEGNVTYTRDLYTTLYRIENRRADNAFHKAWKARFGGRHKEACDTAEALWGDGGRQFPGVLKHDAMNDGSAAPIPNNCR